MKNYNMANENDANATTVKLEPRDADEQRSHKLEKENFVILKKEPFDGEPSKQTDAGLSNNNINSDHVTDSVSGVRVPKSEEYSEDKGDKTMAVAGYISFSDDDDDDGEVEDDIAENNDLSSAVTTEVSPSCIIVESPTPSEQLKPDFLSEENVQESEENQVSDDEANSEFSEGTGTTYSSSRKSQNDDEPNHASVELKSENVAVSNDKKPIIKVKESKFLEDQKTDVSKIEIETEVLKASPEIEPVPKSTSPASSTSSERLTIRSAKQVNDTVADSNKSADELESSIPAFQMETMDGPMCDVCNNRFPDNIVLGQHKSTAGHYKCNLDSACFNLFTTNEELIAHHQTTHGIVTGIPPIAQLAQQVHGMQAPFPTSVLAANNLAQGYTQQIVSPFPTDMNNFIPAQQQNGVAQPRQQFPQHQQRRGGMLPVNNYPMRPPMKRSMPVPSKNMVPQKRRQMTPNPPTDTRNSGSSVLNQLSRTVTLLAKNQTTPSPKKSADTNPVANILANRGITVTATSPQPRRSAQNGLPPIVNLNSAVSIIPTTNKQAKAGNRQPSATVDLTGPDPPRGRSNIGPQFTCQICDRPYHNQNDLNTHLASHRTSKKQLPYRCNQCTAQYPTQSGLVQHKNTFHRGSSSTANNSTVSSDMVIPIVDLRQRGVVSRLQSLGITNYIPLSALGHQNDGTFNIPIISAGSSTNVNHLSALGASNILSLGPLKSLK